MENSIKKLFIEFYGLPGSGKSTLSHIVAERLRKDGHSVDEPSYDIDHQHPLPKKMRKFAIGVFWFLFHHNQYLHIREIVKQNGYNGLTSFTMTVNVIQKMRIYNKNYAEIIIMDQGLIQASISLSTNGMIKANENYGRLLNLIPNAADTSRIYIDVDEETAIDRMSKRVTNDSRVEKLKGRSSKMEMLGCIRKEMQYVREQCAGSGDEYMIVSSNKLMEDSNEVYNVIKQILSKWKWTWKGKE